MNEEFVPLLSQQPVPLQLVLRVVVQEDGTIQLSVVVSAKLEPIWSDDLPTKITCSRGTSMSNGEVVVGTGYPCK